MTTVAIHQPNYLPWLGYFRKIAQADVFVFFDNVQMPMGKSFVSRNRILTAQGPRWLTVPVARSGTPQPISEAAIAGPHWPRKHVMTLDQAYAHAPWRALIGARIVPVLGRGFTRIAALNIALITEIADILGLGQVRFLRATELGLSEAGAASIPEILERSGATAYLTGSGAGSLRHLDEAALTVRGVETVFLSDEFPPYPQGRPGFEANLSVVDALLNCGPEATRALLGAC